jgi:hypothetical protein
MIQFITRKNDIDLGRLGVATSIVGTDQLFLETTGSGDLRKRITFSNFLTSVAANLINTIIPTGIVVPWLTITAPTGWVLASGRTIGSTGSGATERANGDTAALYSLLWQAFSNTELTIQTSTGTPTTRGVSAAADYAADKRLPLPDLRDRGIVGLGNMGGTAANRITSVDTTIIGETGGVEEVTLAEENIPEHDHDTDVVTATALSAATGTDVDSVGAAAPVTSSTFGDATPTPISTLSPFIVLPYIIKL